MFALNSNRESVIESELEGKPFRVMLTAAAQHALAQRERPLIVEMELYFSCLLRLRVLFDREGDDALASLVNPQLAVRFRPVMSRRCDLHAVEGKPPLDDFPIKNRAPYVPHWLHLDFRKGEWGGKFGYGSD